MQSKPLLFSLDLWQALQRETRDILLYGMGNGADKLLAVLEARGIPVRGIFASDGFVRGHSFHGMRVMPYSEMEALYPAGECVVLLAFGSSRPEVLALFDRVAARYPLFVPDLPVCGDQLFDADFYAAHTTDFAAAREMLCDEDSKALFDRVLACKYHADYKELKIAVSEKKAWDYLPAARITAMADLGAYNGDSAREAILRCPSMQWILAVEPDRRNHRKLCEFAEQSERVRIEPHRVAILDRDGEAAFDASGNRNAGLCTGRVTEQVRTATLDGLLDGRRVDYVKYDVEGAELPALQGSLDSIRAHRPALRVALYHRPEDMFRIPLLLRTLCADYSFYLTREPGVPAWDLDLIAIPN